MKIIGIPNKFAVDSTGIQISYRPYYYTQRIGRKARREDEIVRKSHANDFPYLIPLLKNEEKIEGVYADKGYDSLRNIRFVLEYGGEPYIATRKNAHCGLRRRLLKKGKSSEWKKKYSHRNVIESVFHSFKREVGDYIFSHYFYIASKLLLFKVLAYDLYI